MFRTTLSVVHLDGNRWELTNPFVWEGKWDYFVIRTGFETDFASIPKPVRWLLDSSGGNSEAAVLHDAAWRASKVKPDPKVDPWHADGIFRAALRDTGTPALTRGLMWGAVRFGAIVSGRFGKLGPSVPVKILQLAGVVVLFGVAGAVPTAVALAGLFVYWIINWIVGLLWIPFERSKELQTNLPWPAPKKRPAPKLETAPRELLAIVSRDVDGKPSARGQRLEELLGGGPLTEAQIDEVLALPAS